VVCRLWHVDAFRNLVPFGLVAVCVIFFDGVVGTLVAHALGRFTARWILKPVLFITNYQNSEGTPALSGTVGKSIYALLTVFLLGLSLRWLINHRDSPFCSHRIGCGLLVGGLLADGYHFVVVGAVPDFIGIRPLGIFGIRTYSRVFNLADLAISLGALTLCIPVISRWRLPFASP